MIQLKKTYNFKLKSMKTRFASVLFFCLLASASVLASATSARNSTEPLVRKSKVFQQVLKTGAVRILSLELKPGEYLDFHATPEEEVYAATDGTLRMINANGQPQEITVKAGDRLWQEVGQFKNWNTGSKTFKVVILDKAGTSR